MNFGLKNNFCYLNFPANRINFLCYFLGFLLIFFFKLFNKTPIFNLPKEIVNPVDYQKPVLYYRYDEGVAFVNFLENLAKFFSLKIYWLNRDGIINLPENINLILIAKKQKLKSKKFCQFLSDFKKQIKMIIINGKTINTENVQDYRKFLITN